MDIFEGFAETQDSILLLKIACFLNHLIMGIYVGNRINNGNLDINCIYTKYVQEKEYL